MKALASANGLEWNFYTYYGINTAYVLAQALKAAGKDLTREGLVNAMQTQSKNFTINIIQHSVQVFNWPVYNVSRHNAKYYERTKENSTRNSCKSD